MSKGQVEAEDKQGAYDINNTLFWICSATQAAEEPVKLDFESMKIEKNYRRADLRRLSTDSYVKAGDATMATIWDWYWQDEDMGWSKYGEGDPVSGYIVSVKCTSVKMLHLVLTWCSLMNDAIAPFL